MQQEKLRLGLYRPMPNVYRPTKWKQQAAINACRVV